MPGMGEVECPLSEVDTTRSEEAWGLEDVYERFLRAAQVMPTEGSSLYLAV
jgi:hypothetical protein